MPKTIWCLAPLVAYLGMASPVAAWDNAYAAYWSPAVVLYAQYPRGPVRWRVYPRYYPTLYVPAGYRYATGYWDRSVWTWCGC